MIDYFIILLVAIQNIDSSLEIYRIVLLIHTSVARFINLLLGHEFDD